MKITGTIYIAASDTEGGTDSQAFATEREAEDHILGLIGQDRASFEADPEGDFWEFVQANADHLDTFNLTSVDVTLIADRDGPAATVEVR